MRKFLGVLLMAVAVVAASVDAGELKTDEQKRGYALGLVLSQQAARMFGPAMKFADSAALGEGLADGLNAKGDASKLKMAEKEIQETLAALEKDVQAEIAKMAEEEKKAGEKNAAAAKEFLEKNKSAEGVKVTESGLQYIVLKEGTGVAPKDGDNIQVHYTGSLLDGTVFDSSVKRNEPFKLKFPAEGQVIKGWTEALKLLKEGGKIKIFLPPELAYGESGMPPVIPPSSALVFEMELVKVEPAAPAEKK